MPLALDELVRAALRPDRLADAAQPRAGAGVPSTNSRQAGMMRAGLCPTVRHVGELDPLGVAAELLAQPLDLRRADDDERRLAGVDALAQERR